MLSNRRREREREPVPWRWLALGVLLTILAIVISLLIVTAMLQREPLVVTLPTPTIIRLTAPPSPSPTATSPRPTSTPVPTLTLPPTPDNTNSPEAITVGFYARVANTDNIGVSLRGGPSTDNVRLLLVPEGSVLLVMGGPQEGNGFIWWQVQLDDGMEGWVAGDFLIPAERPSDE